MRAADGELAGLARRDILDRQASTSLTWQNALCCFDSRERHFADRDQGRGVAGGNPVSVEPKLLRYGACSSSVTSAIGMRRHQIGHRAADADTPDHRRLRLQRRRKRLHHAGNQHQPADPVARDGVEQRFDLEAVDHHHRAAAEQRRQAVIGGSHMEHRRPRHKAVAVRNVQFGREHQRPHHHRAMRDHRAFRQAGGAAGVENHQAVFAIRRDRSGPVALLLQQALVVRADLDGLVTFKGKRRQAAGQRLLDHHELRRHQFDAIGEFARRQPPVEACGDDAEIGGRQFDFKVFRPVVRQQGHPVAAAQAVTGEHGRSALDPLQQFAITDVPPLIFDRNGGRVNLRGAAKQLADRGNGARQQGGRVFQSACHLQFTPNEVVRHVAADDRPQTIRLRPIAIKPKF